MKKFLITAVAFTMFASTHGSMVLGAEDQSYQKSGNSIEETDIRMYPTLPNGSEKEKRNAVVEHKDAIKLVKEYMEKNNVQIKTDLDDPTYQQYVMSLGTGLGSFSEEEMNKIVSFAKFMDRYENYEKNNKINKYKSKLKNKIELTEEEIGELNELLPIPSDDPSTQENKGSEQTVSAAAVYSNGYNDIKARDYAYKWWDGRNPLYGYYANKEGCSVTDKDCWKKWNDCANFVSQALYAGGMKMYYGSSYTSVNSWNYGVVPSHSWGGANSFYNHWKWRAGVTQSIPALQTGDAVSADTDKDGDMNHTAIITKNWGSTSSDKFLTQHSGDRKETTTIATWLYTFDYTVYGYEIDKATN